MTERHAAQAPALRERYPQIANCQSSIINSGWSGLGIEEESGWRVQLRPQLALNFAHNNPRIIGALYGYPTYILYAGGCQHIDDLIF